MFTYFVCEFGKIGDDSVFKYVLSNGKLTATFLNYGATMISFTAPDRNGKVEELTMNRASLDDIRFKSDYFGSTIGRNAFRINKGVFSLDSQEYTLATNSGNNHNHGGVKGYDKCIWDASIKEEADRITIIFTRISPHMEEGYPGSLTIHASYSLTASNEFDMIFEASGNEVSTIVNMTNHAYWNLAGDLKTTIDLHKLQIDSDYYLDGVDMIPFDEPIQVKNTPMDFTRMRRLAPSINTIDGGGMPGIDHAFVLRDYSQNIDNKTLRHVATLVEEESGRQMDIATTECALIVYTSNWVNEQAPFVPHYSLCLEPGFYPDTPNHPGFPTSTILPGHKYYHHSMFTFSIMEYCVC